MKHLGKIFFFLILLCVCVLVWFIYNDFYKNKSKFKKQNTEDIVFKDDGKIHIVIDAGHGGNDVGAIGRLDKKNVVYEKNIARKVVDIVMSMVDTNKYTVIESRLGDSNTHRHNRVLLAQRFRTDLFLSFHCNANINKTWNGIEIHISDSSLSTKDTTSIPNPNYAINTGFADTLFKDIGRAFPLLKKNKVVHRKDRIWVLYASHFPSIIVEWGYITNKHDLEIMNDPVAQQVLARTVWKSIDEHFGYAKGN